MVSRRINGGLVSIQDAAFDSLVLPWVNSHCTALFLAEIASRYPDDNIVMVLDGAGWHKSLSMPIPGNVRFAQPAAVFAGTQPRRTSWG